MLVNKTNIGFRKSPMLYWLALLHAKAGRNIIKYNKQKKRTNQLLLLIKLRNSLNLSYAWRGTPNRVYLLLILDDYTYENPTIAKKNKSTGNFITTTWNFEV